jgi:hypothetical protein
MNTGLLVTAVGVVGFAVGYLARRAQYKSLYSFNTGLMRYYERTFSQLQDRTIERDQLAAQLRDFQEIEAKRAEADRVAECS